MASWDKTKLPDRGGVPQVADPPYPHRHSGVVLVCGSAACLLDDLAAAKRLGYGETFRIAVNGAAAYVKADALFSQHALLLEKWAREQRKFHDDFEVHTAGIRHRKTKLGIEPASMPWIDYRWQGVSSNASSGWGARRLAHAMGFDMVILCGVPLDHGPYVNGWTGHAWRKERGAVDHYRRELGADIDWHGGCRSMSGWTRELLGGPA